MAGSTTRGLVLLAFAATLTHAPRAAEALQGGRQNPLNTITALRCRFEVATSVLWKEGKPDVRIQAAESRVTISDVDLQDGTAEVSGPRGRRFASTILSDGSLFFIETTPGALDVTTVFATESSPGKLKAARAEYSYVFLTVPPFVEHPTVSQTYGECEPTPGV